MSEQTPVKARWNTGATDDEGKAVYAETEVSFDFGATTAEAVKSFGEEAVFSNYFSAAKIQLQNAVRVHGLAGVAPEDIAGKLTDWVPGQKTRVTADPLAIMKQRYAAASTEAEKESILKDIMGVS
ncbi:hypothetical protein LCGC14_0600900 [marine sediment metagenome]|uniref:Uncharacterized protein n=1 Tax=marine sediment metagenome TaxID=412755 RepID=A0A0F9RFB4_9ZZZZ